MSMQLIKAFPEEQREPQDFPYLEISEFFYDTIQGENNVGFPAAFLRLQNCTLNCTWCDSDEVWRTGNPYGIKELIEMIKDSPLLEKLKNGQHLVLTGGSPLKQQFSLISFLKLFKEMFDFIPYIEIENEAVLKPHPDLIQFVSCWNNSPKLNSSGNSQISRYKQSVLSILKDLPNSWFKFVVTSDDDWDEIKTDYLDAELIRRDQIVLMPEGSTREELDKTRELTVNIAIRENVRFSDREHVIIWNKKTGV